MGSTRVPTPKESQSRRTRGVLLDEPTNETSGNGELEVVVLGEQRHHPGVDGLRLDLALLVLGDDTWPDLDLVAELENTSENRTTGNTTLQLLDLGSGLVDVEGTDDDHVRLGREVAHRHRDLRH